MKKHKARWCNAIHQWGNRESRDSIVPATVKVVRAQSGGRKSVRLEELDPEWFFQLKNGYFVPYLDLIQKDLETRDWQNPTKSV